MPCASAAFKASPALSFNDCLDFRTAMNLTEDTGFDPSTRRLCPDGSCTGILAEGGWCSECRKTWSNVAPAAALAETAWEEPAEGVNADEDAALTTNDEGFDATSRKLCPDGSCTGLMQDNGTCSVCGRSDVPLADVALPTAEA